MLQRRQLQPFDFIEQMMVEPFANRHYLALNILEMAHKACLTRRFAREPDDDTERMTVHATVRVAFCRIGQEVRSIEKEFLVDLHHGIPISL